MLIGSYCYFLQIVYNSGHEGRVEVPFEWSIISDLNSGKEVVKTIRNIPAG